MWRPPERVRHDAQPGRWPTREEAAASRLFSPIQIGACTLNQRTWVPAMVPWRATEDGFVSPNVLAWYERFARGRPGALVLEATGIRDVPSGPLLRIGSDRFVPGLRELVDRVREASGGETKVFIQIIDFLSIRRRPDPSKYFSRFLRITPEHRERLVLLKGLGSDVPLELHQAPERRARPELHGTPEHRARPELHEAPAHRARRELLDAPESEVRAALEALGPEDLAKVLTARELEALTHGARERVTDVELPHVAELPRVLPGLFAAAAERAQAAGFDGVELHYAHAYTMASFLSATNTRTDGYGGTLEGRVRLPLEVYREVRRTVKPGFVVGCRMLSEDCIEGGMTVPESAWFATQLAHEGIDYISLSRGGKFDDSQQPKVGEAAYPYTGRSGYECMPSYYSDDRGPFGRNLAPSAHIRSAIRNAGHETPIITAGGIHNFEQAERVLEAGEGDVVGFARQALADPDWFLKVRSGLGSQVRLCLYTNYCEALDRRHREVTCELWDREALNAPDVTRSSDGKRRLLPPGWDPPGD